MYSNHQPTNLALNLQVDSRLIPVPCCALQTHPCLVQTLRPTLDLVSHPIQGVYSTVLRCVRMLIASLRSRNLDRSDARALGKIVQTVHRVPPELVACRCAASGL